MSTYIREDITARTLGDGVDRDRLSVSRLPETESYNSQTA
jgi:hypothetical protein